MSAKVPPSSLESERSLLGSLLVDKEGITRVADLIAQTDFYDENHGIIYSVILELFRKNRPIDIVTVSEMLSSLGRLDLI